jgi:hypothetical protein
LVRPYNYLLEAIYLILISREMMVVTCKGCNEIEGINKTCTKIAQ